MKLTTTLHLLSAYSLFLNRHRPHIKQRVPRTFAVLALLLFTFCAGAQTPTAGQQTQLTPMDLMLLKKIEAESDPQRISKWAIDLILLSDDKAPLPLLEEAKAVFALAQKKKDATIECVAISMYAQAYRITGDFAKSQQYHFKAIDMAKKLSNYSLLGYALNQSGHMYKDREENDKAIAIYKESSEAANRGTEPFFKFYPIMNLGFVYLQANQPDSALYYSARSVNMVEGLLSKMTDSDQRAIVERSLYVYCLSNLAGSYSKLNDKSNADKYNAQAGAIVNKYQQYKSRYFQFYYFGLAKHYQHFNLTDSSLYAARMAIRAISNSSLEYLSAKPAKMLSDYYETRNADSTVKYLKIFLKGNEVINSTRVTQQLQMKAVEEEQRLLEIKQAEKNYRNRITVYILLTGLAFLLLLALYMYRTSLQRKRINAELQSQKDQVESALTELKSTQAQLVQSEKMASLGELTAGIAHEIQNPLNFVNNFSEVNSELIIELEEAANTGNLDEVKAIAQDLKANEDKIKHHGKRADSIVKGMLQHSQKGSGQKDLTDINALADEYLRLAYHGLKAKDKSFNAQFKTEFDPNIGTVNVVPQDIGRVLLNLISNAFYAVNEKKKTAGEGYIPEVTVSTALKNKSMSQSANELIVSVRDNGLGIPETNRNKIFQPFFTTKPTGEGTGLGLSLSYDIIKAHGGEINVESKEGEGTAFHILLPIK
jgi:two-component system, NtrC family, sensor kinase